MSVRLSRETKRRLKAVFAPGDRKEARSLLVHECADNLPRSEREGPEQLERVRFAAMKVSNGNLVRLREAIQLAQSDWRDLLLDAGFADDVIAHTRWQPAALKTGNSDQKLFLLALSLSLDMGPQTRVPLAKRLFRRAWWTSKARRNSAIATTTKAHEFAWKVGVAVRDGTKTDESALKDICAEYLELGERLAIRLRGHGYYVAMK
jgi:hypothetical protein